MNLEHEVWYIARSNGHMNGESSIPQRQMRFRSDGPQDKICGENDKNGFNVFSNIIYRFV